MVQDEIKTTAEAVEASAMPRSVEVHTDGATHTPNNEALPAAISERPVEEKSPAEWAYQRLILYIKNFEQTLDDEHEVAMSFTDTGAGVLRIEGMGYFDPDIVTFYGTDQTAARVQLVQHVSQLNVILRAMPKAREAAAPRRIGFELAKALDKN
jgi:hypothetical protein